MDKGTSTRIFFASAALIALCAALAGWACRKAPVGPYQNFTSKGHEFVCEVPSDWMITHSEMLHMLSLDEVRMRSATISIYQEREPQPIEIVKRNMEFERRVQTVEPDFKQSPLEVIHFGEFAGLSYSTERILLARDSDPGKNPVPYKETRVFFQTPAGPYYMIVYWAPAAIYEKHRPVFQHLLDTFRWTEGTKTAK